MYLSDIVSIAIQHLIAYGIPSPSITSPSMDQEGKPSRTWPNPVRLNNSWKIRRLLGRPLFSGTSLTCVGGYGPRRTELTEKPLDRKRSQSRRFPSTGFACAQPTTTPIQPFSRPALRSQIAFAQRASRVKSCGHWSDASNHITRETRSTSSFFVWGSGSGAMLDSFS